MHIADSRPHAPQSVLARTSEPRRAARADTGDALHVLYIDDEPSLCALVKEFLRMVGHECDTATSGEAGLEKAVSESFDAVICDMHLPGISGADVCTRLLEEKPSLTGRLLVATGDLLSRETQEFLVRTGLPHIHKPFKLHELNAALQGLARMHPAEFASGNIA